MNAHTWLNVMQRAKLAGLLPEEATTLDGSGRAWPVLILTFCGAMLAAIPLMLFFGMMFGPFLLEGPGTYLCGALLMAGGCVVLRAEGVLLFIEHVALVALGVGIALLAAALFRDAGVYVGALSGGLLCLLAACFVALSWVRSLLGLCAFGLLLLALMEGQKWLEFNALWGWTSVLAGLWLLALLFQYFMARRGQPRTALLIEALQGGWLIGVLACFAFASGQTLLIGGVMGGSMMGALGGLLQEEMARHSGFALYWRSALATCMPVAVWLWAMRRWALAQHWLAGVLVLSLAMLAWFMPALGAVAALSAICLLTGRYALAAAGALAAAWVIGAFYYQLSWPLYEKAQLLCGLGALLGVAVWVALRQGAEPAPASTRSGLEWRAAAMIGLGALASLLVLNSGIWQKEQLIASGRKVFIELAPVDPRSLMQGDYMALNYKLSPDLRSALHSISRSDRPRASGSLDERGVLRLERLEEETAPGSVKVQLLNKGGRWLVASDAWYFREGEGQKWAAARYAEFRLLPDGRALLVGMADASLRPIMP